MNVAASASPPRNSHAVLVGVLSVLAVALLWFVGTKFHYFSDYSLRSYSDYYWPRRSGLLLHLTGGMLAISTGLVQIWLGLTNRVNTLHRVLGKVYGAGVLLGSLGGLYMALTIPGHLAYRTGLLGLTVAWVVTTGMALYAINLRRIEQHREWMLRSYTVTFAFITFRLGEQILRNWITLPDDPVADDLDTAMAWACWAIPLLFAETLIQLRSMRRPARATARQATPGVTI
jgi:drug/metabolite transporter (DMT)-like permease